MTHQALVAQQKCFGWMGLDGLDGVKGGYEPRRALMCGIPQRLLSLSIELALPRPRSNSRVQPLEGCLRF
jgi:hypothetical protein